MLDKDKIVVVAIGLVVLVGSIGGGLVWGQRKISRLLWFWLLKYFTFTEEEASAKFGRVLLAPASALLAFGAMSARKEHRIKIQIVWLLASVVYLATMMNMVGAHWYDTDLKRTVAYTSRCYLLFYISKFKLL